MIFLILSFIFAEPQIWDWKKTSIDTMYFRRVGRYIELRWDDNKYPELKLISSYGIPAGLEVDREKLGPGLAYSCERGRCIAKYPIKGWEPNDIKHTPKAKGCCKCPKK